MSERDGLQGAEPARPKAPRFSAQPQAGIAEDELSAGAEQDAAAMPPEPAPAPMPVAASEDADSDTKKAKSSSRRFDILQTVYWVSLLIAVAAASVAIAWPSAVGEGGPVLLIALAASGMVFLLWLARGAGRSIGLFPGRGSVAGLADAHAPRLGWIEALDHPALVSDPGGAPLVANEAFKALSREALLVAPDGEMEPPSVDRLFGAAPGIAASVYRLSRSAQLRERRRELLPPVTLGRDGAPAQFEVSVSPLGRARVLWQLRRIEDAGAASAATDFRSLYIEQAPVGFMTSRPDGTIIYANRWLRELAGLGDDVRGTRLDDVMRPEYIKSLSKERKTGAAGRAEIVLKGKGGVPTPAHAITTWSGRGVEAAGRTVLLPAMKGAAAGGAGMPALSAKRPPRPGADPMFDDAPFGAVRLDGDSVADSVILDANRALMNLTDGAATPGTPLRDLFAAGDGPDALADALSASVTKPTGLKLAGGEDRQVNVYVVLNELGQPIAGYIIDMTEQRELELRLAQGEKMQAIGQLAGGIAHDFNNMLTGITLNNDTLLEMHPVGDPSYAKLQNIHSFSIRAADLVRMLLAYARKQSFRSESIDASEFLSDFGPILSQILDDRIKLEIRHGQNLPSILADRSQLETAIINLSTNARDAMLAEGRDVSNATLVIETEAVTEQHAYERGFDFVEEGEYLLIKVADNGDGIDPEILPKMFEPFQTTKPIGLGTGLGLSTCYGIIKQSGGFICADSVPGEGATFFMYLPAYLEESDAEDADSLAALLSPDPETAPPARDYSGRGRILLVEDEDGVRSVTATMLRMRGYEVEEAPDGEEALDIIKSSSGFDLIISDVVMPGMDGPTLIREARDYLGSTKVLFISGYAEQDVASQLSDARKVSFLAKPFGTKELAERVKLEMKKTTQPGARPEAA